MGERSNAQREKDILSERIRYLEKLLGIEDELLLSRLYGLSALESRIFALIVRRGLMSTDSIQDGLYLDFQEPEYGHTIRVLISRIRKKMRGHGVEIRNLYGQGYVVDEPARTAIRAALAKMREALAMTTGLQTDDAA